MGFISFTVNPFPLIAGQFRGMEFRNLSSVRIFTVQQYEYSAEFILRICKRLHCRSKVNDT